MTTDIVGARRDPSSRRDHFFSRAPARSHTQGLHWIPMALGAAAVAAALSGRRKGAAALALAAVAGAGAGAAGALRGKAGGQPEVERSITIGKSADALRDCWRDPRTLPRIMAGFAAVRPGGDGRMHWKVEGPLGSVFEWETETVDRPGEAPGWRSLPDGSIRNEGSIRFHPAPADRGTVVTLRVRFDPPGGALGDWTVEHLGSTPLGLVVEGALRRFKNLVETGEIPTTERQPAARADTH